MIRLLKITIGGRETEYDVIHVNAYVTAIMNRQAETYSEYESSKLPHKAVKEIYVEGVLRAELIGSKLYQFISGKRDWYDAYVDRQEPKEKELERESIYLKSVNSPPPYWTTTTDNSAGNIDIIYTN